MRVAELGSSFRGIARPDVIAIAGYALTLVFFGLFTGRVNPLFFGANPMEVFAGYAHAAEIGQFSCLFLVGMCALRWRLHVERAITVLATILLASGYALTLNMTLGEGLPGWYANIAGAVFGAGQGACFLGWLCVFSRMEFGAAARDMVSATVLSAALLLVVGCMPTTASLFSVLSLVVVGSCFLLFVGIGRTVPDGDYAVAPREQLTWLRSWIFLERRSLLCLLALAFVCGAQRVISLEGFLDQNIAPLLFAFGYAVGAVAYALATRFHDADDSYFGMYTLLLVAMATTGVFSFVQNEAVQTILYAIDNIAFTIVSICMVMMAVSTSHRAKISPLGLGGIVCGGMYFAIQMGRLVCNAVGTVVGGSVVSGLVVSVIIIYVLALAAITSGAFVRQVAGTPEPRSIISISPVTPDTLRANPVYRQTYGITERELDVLVLLLAGYNSSDIAEMLSISPNTVKTHLKSIYAKTGVHNRRELSALLNEVEATAPDTTR